MCSLSRIVNETAPAKAAAVPEGSAHGITKSIGVTSATAAPVSVASAASEVEKFGWRDVNQYLKWYAAERYLTGGTTKRKGPPWAARHHLSSSVGTNKAATKKSRSAFSDRGQPLRLRAHACAGRVATLLWEHGDSLWRLLCRGDRFQGCVSIYSSHFFSSRYLWFSHAFLCVRTHLISSTAVGAFRCSSLRHLCKSISYLESASRALGCSQRLEVCSCEDRGHATFYQLICRYCVQK